MYNIYNIHSKYIKNTINICKTNIIYSLRISYISHITDNITFIVTIQYINIFIARMFIAIINVAIILESHS